MLGCLLQWGVSYCNDLYKLNTRIVVHVKARILLLEPRGLFAGPPSYSSILGEMLQGLDAAHLAIMRELMEVIWNQVRKSVLA